MQAYWLHRHGADSVIIFFAGWGADFRPFQSIPHGGSDVLIVYAYHTQGSLDWQQLLAPYREYNLIAWSMGVLQAELTFRQIGIAFRAAIAVNGTLLPVDDQYGIPASAYQLTIDSFSPQAHRKFIQRMCGGRDTHLRYSESLPLREIGELRDELIYHQQQSDLFGTMQTEVFTSAIIGSGDLIFPPSNLLRFWDGKVAIVPSQDMHFIFYRYDSWFALVQFADKYC